MDWLAERLLAYGLDDRARSAIRALGRSFGGVGGVVCASNTLAGLLEVADSADPAHKDAVRFVETFLELPEVDFAPEWLNRLAASWLDLHRRGMPADFPLRTAHALQACAAARLLGEGATLSRLGVEITVALGAAGACVAGMLLEHAAQTAADLTAGPVGQEGPRRLLDALTSALAERGDGLVGLLLVRFHPGAATLTWDAREREALCHAVLGRVGEALREGDAVLRTELHALAVILPKLHSEAQATMAANKVARVLDSPLIFDGQAIKVPLHVGVAWAPGHGEDAAALVRGADLAVNEARRLGSSVHVFEQGLQQLALEEARLEQEFVAAMDNGQLDVHVQPQVDLRSGRVVGGEALMRWTDSMGRAVPPYRAPEIAQRLGLGAQLRRWLVHRGCRVVADLARAGIGFNVSVNLTAADLGDTELPLLLVQALQLWGAPAERLTFELTESAMLEDAPEAARLMAQLRELGSATAIDDFGVGYSSVSYLRQLPLNELKIDRIFVAAAATSPQDRNIVESLIKLAHALGLEVVAEGVEDAATLALLRELDCDRMQGYLIARAMPVAELPEWLARWDPAAFQAGPQAIRTPD